MTQLEVEKWIGFMREHGVKRLVLKDFEVELGGPSNSYSKALEPMAQQGVFEDATGSFCACGHSWVTEHSDAGCLMGCSHDLCSSSAGSVTDV
jgi:hypothetical protein